ncbi:hypothetical protein BV25DRAFT_1916846 [Artomyces pyxidatus]|uniref:Uncharacterized protein n=1 Tax=Artomyces pyxidatus TaxID=48021 RepID=A0ACB8SZ78_9AGAM|nr:hypothetical protein BV25DRAFT_1916846 [Artomyces pyxidatus]
MDLTEKLRRLKAYNAAWTELEWTGHAAHADIPRDSYPVVVSGGVVAFKGEFRHEINLERMPSLLRGIKGRHWAVGFEELGGGVSSNGGVNVDVSQDLLVVATHHVSPNMIQSRLHLRSLSTGEVHPFGCNFIDVGTDRMLADGAMDIHDNLILLRVCMLPMTWPDISMHAMVFDWTTGIVLLDTPSQSDPTHGSNPCFLDCDHIVTVVAGPDGNSDTRRLEVLSFRDTALDDHSHPTCFFVLPDVMTNSTTTSLHIHAGRTSSYGSALWHGVDSDSPPFYEDPGEKLLSVFVSKVDFPHRFTYSFVVDFSARLLLANAKSRRGIGVVPWNDWGPSTSCVHGPHAARGKSMGMRRIEETSTMQDAMVLFTVFDYHPRRVARARSRRSIAGSASAAVVDVTEINLYSAGEISGQLRTTLPYLVKRVPLRVGTGNSVGNYRYTRAMLCEDGVVVYQLNKYADNEPPAVLSFTF